MVPGWIGSDDAAALDRALFDAFCEAAAAQPGHLAIDDGTTRLSYAALRDQAQAFGERIAAQVPADGLVGILMPVSALLPLAWLACQAARRAFLPFDPLAPPARNQGIAEEAGLAAVIVPSADDALAQRLPAHLPCIPMAAPPGPHPPALPSPNPPPLPPGLPPSTVGMVMFTSGSTGRPKGIALDDSASLHTARVRYRPTGLGPDDRLLSLCPPWSGAGPGDIFSPLLRGACLHLTDLRRDGLAHVLGLLRGGGITVFSAVPGVARALIAMDGAAEAFRRLRVVRLTGQAIMGSDIAALARLLPPSARILAGFGTTENGGTLIQRLVDPAAPVETGRIAVGRPLPGYAVSVEDAAGNPVGPGAQGELVIRGRTIALGRWAGGRIDATAFPADPIAPGARCYRSGDVALLREDGMIVPIGRADRQAKINGMRVEPAETETALHGLPNVMDAAAIVHGPAEAPELVAFVVPAGRAVDRTPGAANAAGMASELRLALAGLLPSHQVPARIHLVPSIPLLPSLKPDLAALQALLVPPKVPGVLARIRLRLSGARARGMGKGGAPAVLGHGVVER
jgi:acyl-coenzyme A synthetase/AMP-(fatty) acid ligase